ncbi:MAG: nucleotidyltransferase family protein, partial [Pelagibacterales bacterium]|nr:nucleotidyltransferase family protein [Pelagibacterales bacterium]
INKREKNLVKDSKYKITNIILAAGQSKRMLKDNKLLIKINKQTMLERMIFTSLNSNANNTVLVLGYQSDIIQEIIQNNNITTVINTDYKKGLSSSLQCGISALPDDCDAAIIILADMPNIDNQVINRMINSFNPSKNNSIIIPTFNGKKGNPILLARKFFPDILRVKGDKGAKDIIINNKKSILEIPQKNSSVLNDIDTKEDLSLYLKNNS